MVVAAGLYVVKMKQNKTKNGKIIHSSNIPLILKLRNEGFTLDEIAVRFGVTRERIRQIIFKQQNPEKFIKKKIVFEVKKCSWEGCKSNGIAKGYCKKHYERLFLKFLQHEKDKQRQEELKQKREKNKCLIENCTNLSMAKGMCQMHFKRQYYNEWIEILKITGKRN